MTKYKNRKKASSVSNLFLALPKVPGGILTIGLALGCLLLGPSPSRGQNCQTKVAAYNHRNGPDSVNTNLSLRQWHHVAITKSGTVGRLFIDGQQIVKGNWANVNYDWNNLFLGAKKGNGWTKHLNGSIDELRVSDTVRKAAAIIKGYQANRPFQVDSATVGLWHFDSSASNHFYNAASTPLSDSAGELINGAALQPGKFKKSVSFDGVNDRAACHFNMPENHFTIEFWVKLNLTNGAAEGCMLQPFGAFSAQVTATQKLLNVKPSADFTVKSDSAQCLTNNQFKVANQSSVAQGSLTYQWDFGDGTTASSPSPKHSYDSAGFYQIQLVATSDRGCRDTISRGVTVEPKPNAAFGINDPGQCLDSNQFNFTIDTSGKVRQLYFEDFEGSDSGWYTYTACTGGCPNGGPTAPRTVTTDATDEVYRGGEALKAQHPLNGACGTVGLAYDFDFAIQPDSIVLYLNYEQDAFGNNEVVIKDDDSSTHHVVFTRSPLSTPLDKGYRRLVIDTVSDFSKDFTLIIGNKDENSSYCDFLDHGWTTRADNIAVYGTKQLLSNLSYQWHFGDDSTSTKASPSHSYARDSLYRSELIVSSDKGCKDTTDKTMAVHPEPTARFAVQDTCQPNPLDFSNQSTVNTGTIAAYKWDFGDDSTSSATTPVYRYDSFGRYEVRLTAVTGKGCRDASTQSVEVFPKPIAGFSTTDVCRVERAHFKDSSKMPQASLQQWDWQLGDSTNRSGATVKHTYHAADTYDVQLTVTSTDNCQDTAVKPLTVYPMPESRFVTNDTAQCRENAFFTFTNKSRIPRGTLTYRWESVRLSGSPNSDSAFSRNYERALKDTGDYRVKLKTTSDFGCVATDSQLVAVHPDPVANFSVRKGCINAALQVRDESTTAAGVVDSWQWRMGNGAFKTAQNPAAKYDTGGIYNIQLVATTNYGCHDTAQQANRIYGTPKSATVKRVLVVQDSFNRIEWSPSPSPNPGAYKLYRSTNSPVERDRLVGSYRSSDTVIKDHNVRVDSQDYYYTLAFQDSCGLKYPHLTYGRTIHLNAANHQSYPQLSFNPYEGWAPGVQHYQVQWRTTNDNGYQAVGTTDTTFFIDSQTRKQENPYCYRVVGYKAGSASVSSVSNERCLNTESAIFIPDAFTPNGDHNNDLFRPKGSYVLDYAIKIYNRWGELVFESNNRQKPWDGRKNGQLAPEGIYQYVIRVQGTEGLISKTGSVTLIR